MINAQAYCVKCRKIQIFDDSADIDISEMKNGAKLLKGKCCECGAVLCRFVRKDWSGKGDSHGTENNGYCDRYKA